MADDIEPLNTVPAAFADIAAKLNEIVAYVNAMKNARAGGGLDYKWTGGAGGPAKLVPLHSIDITKLISALDAAGYSRAVAAAAVNISVGGGGGASYSTYTFAACVSGAPKTFVIPIVSGPT